MSRKPPRPGTALPESLMPAERLRALSKRSPNITAAPTASPRRDSSHQAPTDGLGERARRRQRPGRSVAQMPPMKPADALVGRDRDDIPSLLPRVMPTSQARLSLPKAKMQKLRSDSVA